MSSNRLPPSATLNRLSWDQSQFVILYNTQDNQNASWVYDYHLQILQDSASFFYIGASYCGRVSLDSFASKVENTFKKEVGWGFFSGKNWLKPLSILKKAINEQIKVNRYRNFILIFDDFTKFQATEREKIEFIKKLQHYWEKHWAFNFTRTINPKVRIFLSGSAKPLNIMLTLSGTDLKESGIIPIYMYPEKNPQLNINNFHNTLADIMPQNIPQFNTQLLYDPFSPLNTRGINRTLEKNTEKYGFLCSNVIGDGNCFFHAALEQLKIINLNKFRNYTATKIRQEVINHIENNSGEYNFVSEHFQNYINRFRNNNEWADDVLISAFSNHFNINLAIIYDDARKPTLIRRLNPQGEAFFGYEINKHYLSLIVDPSIQAAQKLSFEKEAYSLCQSIPEEKIESERITERKARENFAEGFFRQDPITKRIPSAYQHRFFNNIDNRESKDESDVVTFHQQKMLKVKLHKIA